MSNSAGVLTQINPTIAAALVSAVVALIVAAISARVAQRSVDAQAELKLKELSQLSALKLSELDSQANLKARELDSQARLKSQELDSQARLKAQELELMAARLRAEEEAARQTQLTEIVKKRIETYPAFYEILAVYGRNWEIEGKAWDHAWAWSFLKALVDHNAKNGAFFSELLYKWYGVLRSKLEMLNKDLGKGREATDEEIATIFDIIRGPMLPEGNQAPGLGSLIKDELGSYITAAVSATHHSNPEWRELLHNPEGLLADAARARSYPQA